MRRSPVIAVIVALGLAPGLARADHLDGAAGGSFNPSLSVFVATPFVNQPSETAVTLRQLDHEDPIVTADVRIPSTWDLEAGLSSLKPAKTPAGAPATSCAQAIDGLGDGSRFNARVARAEIIGGGVLEMHADGLTRTGSDANPSDGPISYDVVQALLSYDGAAHSGRACLLMVTRDARLTSLPDPDPVAEGDGIEAITEIVVDYTIGRAGAGGAWRAVLDLSTFAKDPTLQALNAGVVRSTFTWSAASAGNWNGARAPVARTPAEPGSYEFVAVLSTCPAADPAFGSCASNAPPRTRAAFAHIGLPQTGSHPVSTLLSPTMYGVLTGTAEAPVVWLETLGSEKPAGYVITLARPGQTRENLIYRSRLMAADPGYPCDAATKLCTLKLRFPLAVPNGDVLSGNEKYSVSVVTIFADGHRSDGRCDDGTPMGTKAGCTAQVTFAPGFSHAEFLLRRASWPLRFRDDETFDRRVDDGALSHDVLLINPNTLAVEYVVWNFGGPANAYPFVNDRIFMTGDGGVFDCIGNSNDLTRNYSLRGYFQDGEARAVLLRPQNYVGFDTPSTPGDVVRPRRVGPVSLPMDVQQPRPFHGFQL